MIIAQITDLHVVGNGQLCQGRVATNAQLQAAVAHINSFDPRPDVVLATGDLTDHGTAEEYDALRESLAALLPPLYLVPGKGFNVATRSCAARNSTRRRPLAGRRRPPPSMVAERLPSDSVPLAAGLGAGGRGVEILHGVEILDRAHRAAERPER